MQGVVQMILTRQLEHKNFPQRGLKYQIKKEIGH